MTRRWWRRTAQPDPYAVPAEWLDPAAIRPERPDSDAARPDLLAAWAQVVDVSRVSNHTVRWAEDYLRRYRRMFLAASREEAYRLMTVIEKEVSPPPPPWVHPLDIIATVLAVRRERGIV